MQVVRGCSKILSIRLIGFTYTAVQNFNFMIKCALKQAMAPVDLHENLILQTAPYIRPLIFGFSNKVSGTGWRMFNA